MINEYKTIGVILEDDAKLGLNHTYFSEILEAFRVFYEEKGISLIFLNNARKFDGAKTYLEQLKEYGCLACMIACVTDSQEVNDILDSDIPVVAIDKSYQNCINVSSDNDEGTAMLTEYVISMGHKRIAYMMGDDNFITKSRLNAFLKTCENHSISIPDNFIISCKYRNVDMATYHTENLLKMEQPPTCIMYTDDYASIGGINIINARGLTIPRDISITGYDGNDILSQYEPKLTTIKQDGVAIGQLAATKLLEVLEDPTVNNKGNHYVTVSLEKGRTVKKVYAKAQELDYEIFIRGIDACICSHGILLYTKDIQKWHL